MSSGSTTLTKITSMHQPNSSQRRLPRSTARAAPRLPPMIVKRRPPSTTRCSRRPEHREADDRGGRGRSELEARRIAEQLVDLGRQRVEARAVPDRRRRPERAHRLEEHEHRRREDSRQHQRHGDAERAAPGGGAGHLRRLLIGRVHVVERRRDGEEDERIEAEGEHQNEPAHAVDVERAGDAEGIATGTR